MLFVNFEDERITDIKKEDLHLILKAYRELFAFQPIIFLDEIQNVEGWEHFARRLADEELFYYNRNVEIDFCVPKEGLLIQVSYRMVDEATRIREVGALQKVGKFLKAKKCMIVTYDQEETIPSENLGFDIEVVPIYKFLLI